MTKSIYMLSSIFPLFLVAACFGGEPSEKEARAAYVEADSGTDYFADFKLNACKAASGAPGYQCDVSFKLQGGPFLPASGRFFKAGDKWVFERSRGR